MEDNITEQLFKTLSDTKDLYRDLRDSGEVDSAEEVKVEISNLEYAIDNKLAALLENWTNESKKNIDLYSESIKELTELLAKERRASLTKENLGKALGLIRKIVSLVV